jgi:cation:H+ antiporter
MTEWLEVVKLTGGLVYLLLGGDLLVRGAIGFSVRTNIPEAIVGLTIVALGTSAPELFVSIYAAIAGHSEIAIGNVVGSNIANVLLVLGVPALIHPISTREYAGLGRDSNRMMGVTLLLRGLGHRRGRGRPRSPARPVRSAVGDPALPGRRHRDAAPRCRPDGRVGRGDRARAGRQ